MNTLPNATPEKRQPVPSSAEFRAWVRASLDVLGVTASHIARRAGFKSRETLLVFLREDHRGIGLSNAHDISCVLHSEAKTQAVRLPEMGGDDE